MNFGIWTRPSEFTSKIIQKSKIWGLVTFKKYSKFSIESYETFTHDCEKTVICIKILTSASEREPRDLGGSVLWRYTDMFIRWVFMILLNWWNRRLFKIRNHQLPWNSFYIKNIFSIHGFRKRFQSQSAIYIKTL